MADAPLGDGIDQVLAAWAIMAMRNEMSEQTLAKFALLLGRFRTYASVHGVVLVSDVTPRIASGFIDAKGRSRHGQVSAAALATRHLRRSVLRMFFRTARQLGLDDGDPTRDVELPRRTQSSTRPLTEDEAIALRQAADFLAHPTRHAAAAALALSGGHTGEIGHASIQDLDLSGKRVWLHGSSKITARWCPLNPWALHVLRVRARHVIAHPGAGQDTDRLKLAVSSTPGSNEQLQARSCVALTDLLHRIGLAGDPAVRPASITAYTGAQLFAWTGRIEAVARRLGLTSLDRAAAVIGYDWDQPQAVEADRKVGRDAC
ncbi:hypothetical protein ACWGCW_04260 [Streptomyces sp. NPDC054933]